jgi:tRNA(Ile)-lysidine synthase
MAKRHRPPTLLTLAHRLVRDEQLFTRGDLVICACSGGPDSNALLHGLALLRRRLGHQLCALGVDHGLRPEAASELAVAQAIAQAQGVPFETVALQVAPGSNLQARARQARHEALQQFAARRAGAVIATGHTADDRAETVMMRLLRGAGPKGLAVLPPLAPPIATGVPLVRPLLTCCRADVVAHLSRHRLAYATDPSNRDRRFLRTRVRYELMPLLEELSPGIVGHLCALAAMLDSRGAATDGLAQLGRAQRLAVDRAFRLGRRQTTVRVSGGRDLLIRFFGNSPVVWDEE